MAKKVVVTDKVKIRGIRRRWLINSVGVVLLVLALALGTFSTAMWSYYYSSTMNDLKRRAADDAGGFASFTRSQYWTNAQNAVQKFDSASDNIECSPIRKHKIAFESCCRRYSKSICI